MTQAGQSRVIANSNAVLLLIAEMTTSLAGSLFLICGSHEDVSTGRQPDEPEAGAGAGAKREPERVAAPGRKDQERYLAIHQAA